MKLFIQKLFGVLFNDRYTILCSTSNQKRNNKLKSKNNMLDYYVHYAMYKLYVSKNLNRPKSTIYFTNASAFNDIYALYKENGKIEIQEISKLIKN